MEKVTRDLPSNLLRPNFRPRATRYEPSRSDACLTLWDAGLGNEAGSTASESSRDPAVRQLFALLLDISQTGASIALDRVPRKGESVWFRLEGQDITDWTAAEVVGVTTTSQGPHLVRLAFRSPCPFETLQAAILG